MHGENPLSPHSEIELGSSHKCMRCIVKVIHIVDFVVGLILLVYGGMISVTYLGSFVPTFFVVFGSVLLLSLFFGFIGLRTSVCKRVGVSIAAWLALPNAALYLVMGFYILFQRDNWRANMKQYQQQLYLNDATIQALYNGAPGFFVGGIVLAFAEVCRFYMMIRIRRKLLEVDAEKSPFGDSRTDPLLSLDEDGSSSSSDFLPLDEESLHSDPLWWAKSKRTETGDLSWAKEGL